MSQLIIAGDTSGTVTLQAPAVAGSTTLTLPSVSGNIITSTGGVTPSTAGNVLTSDGTNWTSASKLTIGSVQTASASTNLTFTGIPSWAKRITILWKDLVQVAGADFQIQIGSGSVQTTGYVSASGNYGNNSSGATYVTNAFYVRSVNTASAHQGYMTLSLMTGNTWASQHNNIGTATYVTSGAGMVVATGAIDRVIISATTGTLTSGTVNIIYE